MPEGAIVEAMTNAEYQSRIIALGIMRADIVRMNGQLDSQEARWQREANDPGFATASVGYGLLFTALVPLALFAPVIFPAILVINYHLGEAGRTAGVILGFLSWGLVFQYGRIVRARFEKCRVAIQAAFEERMNRHAAEGFEFHSSHPESRCPRCLNPFTAGADYCTVCGKAA
jgi:hypothetical protein